MVFVIVSRNGGFIHPARRLVNFIQITPRTMQSVRQTGKREVEDGGDEG